MRKLNRTYTGCLGLPVFLALLFGCKDDTKKLHHIYFEHTESIVAPGDTFTLYVRAYPEEATRGYPDDVLHWASSDTSVLSVTDNGFVTALKYGTAEISVTFGPLVARQLFEVTNIFVLPDSIFSVFIMSQYDFNGNGRLDGIEVSPVIDLNLKGLNKLASRPISMKGIENFVNAQRLIIEDVDVSYLDVSTLAELREIDLERVGIDVLDLRSNAKIERVHCVQCDSLSQILFGSYAEFGKNELRTFDANRCNIGSVDLSRCGATLWDVNCSGNPNLASLDLSVDTMVHSVKYSCGTTDVAMPTGIETEQIAVFCVDY